jgi:hypothetical protein
MIPQDSLTDKLTVDFQSIPPRILAELAAVTVESVKAFLQQQGGREYLKEVSKTYAMTNRATVKYDTERRL